MDKTLCNFVAEKGSPSASTNTVDSEHGQLPMNDLAETAFQLYASQGEDHSAEETRRVLRKIDWQVCLSPGYTAYIADPTCLPGA
jgi:hypothetical protein